MSLIIIIFSVFHFICRLLIIARCFPLFFVPYELLHDQLHIHLTRYHSYFIVLCVIICIHVVFFVYYSECHV